MSLQINQSLRRKELFFLKVHSRTWTIVVMMFVFFSRGPSLTLWRKPQVKSRGGKCSSKSEYDDSPLITVSFNGKQIAWTAGMSGKCHITLKCVGLLPCKWCCGMWRWFMRAITFVCVPSAVMFRFCVCICRKDHLSVPDSNAWHVSVEFKSRGHSNTRTWIYFPQSEVFAQLVICNRELELVLWGFSSPVRH